MANQQSPVLIEEGNSHRIFSLIKFLSSDYVDDFVSGRLRMGSVRGYRDKYKGEPGKRNDQAEFLSDLHQPDKIVLEINGHRIDGIRGPVEIRRNLDHRSYLFCMTAITDKFLNKGDGVQKLSPRLLALGDKAVLVTNTREFIRRLERGPTEHRPSG